MKNQKVNKPKNSIVLKNLSLEKIKNLGYGLLIASVLTTGCGTDKTDPTKAWEKHDKAKEKRIELEQDVADKQEEIKEDTEDLEKLQEKLNDARSKEAELLRDAQREADNYK